MWCARAASAAALARDPDLPESGPVETIEGICDQLRDPLGGKEAGHIKDRLRLVPGRKVDRWLIGILGGNGAQACGDVEMLGMPELELAGEALDRWQPDFADAGAVSPPGLEMVEKGEDVVGVEMIDR